MMKLPGFHGPRFFQIALSICLSFVLSGGVSDEVNAQAMFGSVKGVVLDVNGEPVQGTRVILEDNDRGSRVIVSVQFSGEFTFTNVRPGVYTLSAEQTGFKTAVAVGLVVSVDQTVYQTLVIQQGLEDESDAAPAGPAPMQRHTTDVRVHLGQDEMRDLPLPNYRSYQTLINFAPGATPGRFQETVSQAVGVPLTTNVNGIVNNNVTEIDGVRTVDAWMPHQVAYVTPAENVDVLSVSTNNFDTEQGLVSGGALTVITRSGGNSFHGSVFGFHENSELNARDFFTVRDLDDDGIIDQPKGNRTIAGATVGGPLKEDEFFFFVGWEGVFQKFGRTSLETVPTAEQRIGDFSSFDTTIYDPLTGNSDGSGREPFEQNIIPRSRIDDSARQMQAALPFPNLSGLVSNYEARGEERLTRNNVDLKVDWNRLVDHRVWGKFGLMLAKFEGENVLEQAGGGGFDGEGDGDADANTLLFGLGHSWTHSPNLLLDAHGGVAVTQLDLVPGDLDRGQYGRDVLGIQGTNATDDSCQVDGVNRCGGIPAFFVPGYSGIGQVANWNPLYRNDWSINFTQNVGWFFRGHDLRFGYDLVRHQIEHWQPAVGAGPRGAFTFNREMTSVPGFGATDQNAWASFLLGFQSGMGKTLQWETMTSSEWQHGVYIRDRWQPIPKLTLTLGLRWEYFPMARRSNRNMEVLDLETFDVFLDNDTKVSYSLLAPRVGVAFQISDDDLVRGGYGVATDPSPYASGLRGFYPLQVAGNWAAPNPYVPFSALEEGIPVINGPDLDVESVDLPSNMMQRTMPIDMFNRGRVRSWNAFYERRLPSDVVFSVGYVGSRTEDQLADRELNWSRPGGGTEGRQLYPLSSSSILLWDGWLDAEYHAFQATVNRRFTDGLFLRGAYTFSKAMNRVDNAGLGGLLWNDTEIINRNRAEAGFSRPHVFQLASLWQIPTGSSGIGIVDMIVRNWQLNGIFSFYSNTPFTVTASGALLNAPGNIQTPDQVGPVARLGGIGADSPYFSTGSFAAVTRVPGVDCTGADCYGSSGRNILRGPDTANLDLSIFRDFRITRGMSVELRGEVFNVTNSAQFNNPNGDFDSHGFMTITSTDPNVRNRVIRLGVRLKF